MEALKVSIFFVLQKSPFTPVVTLYSANALISCKNSLSGVIADSHILLFLFQRRLSDN